MRTSELSGAVLALWVARALKMTQPRIAFDICRVGALLTPETRDFAPHEDWSCGGPLIEQQEIGIGIIQGIAPHDGTEAIRWAVTKWHARVLAGDNGGPKMEGPTPLVAAMRALVASVYGDTVPDEVAP